MGLFPFKTSICRIQNDDYFEETLFNAIVIAARLIEDKNKAEELLKVSVIMINQALNTERPEVGLNICKAMTKMCERLLLDSHESYYLLGLCHYKMVLPLLSNVMYFHT